MWCTVYCMLCVVCSVLCVVYCVLYVVCCVVCSQSAKEVCSHEPGCKKHGVHLSKTSYFVCGTSVSSSKHLGHHSSAHFFWTSDITRLFFQFFPTCPLDKCISIFFFFALVNDPKPILGVLAVGCNPHTLEFKNLLTHMGLLLKCWTLFDIGSANLHW